MAIPVTNVNPLPLPVAPAATPAAQTDHGVLFQTTLASAAAQQAERQQAAIATARAEEPPVVGSAGLPLLTFLEDTGQLASLDQQDFPNTTDPTTESAITNQANEASLAAQEAQQAQQSSQTNNANGTNTTNISNVATNLADAGLLLPSLILQQNIAAQGIPTPTGTANPSTSTAAITPESLSLAEQLRLQIASSTQASTTEVGTTTGQTTPAQAGLVPTQPATPQLPATPAQTATTAEATQAVPIPTAGNVATNPVTASAITSQNQTIPAQIPIVAGMQPTVQTATQQELTTPQPVSAAMAAAPLPSAQAGDRPLTAGNRLAAIAEQGANLQSAQSQSTTFQSTLSQTTPGTTQTTGVTSPRVVATTASLTALSAQPLGTSPATPTSSVVPAGETVQPLTIGSQLQQLAVESANQQREGLVAAVVAPADQTSAKNAATSADDNAATVASLLANAAPAGTVPSSAGPTPANAVAPTVATQVADGVITHAQAFNQNGTAEFRLRLDPPELGPVNVHLVSNGDEVRGHVIVSSDSVRQMIESQLPELRQRLEAAGVTIQNFSVSADTSGGGNRNSGYIDW